MVPQIQSSCQCQLVDSAGQPDPTWHAWVSEYAVPLDEILKENRVSSKFCILGAVYAMVRAHSFGFVMSDNALSNFGMEHDNVVIIDAGSRDMYSETRKGEFNKRARMASTFTQGLASSICIHWY